MRIAASSLLLVASLGIAGQASAGILLASDWEAPTWAVGNVSPQNGWFNDPSGGAEIRHKVVAGTVTVFDGFGNLSQTVSPLSGNQMHRSDTFSTPGSVYAFPDLSGSWSSRGAGNDTLHFGADIFIPIIFAGSGATNLHGLDAYDTTITRMASFAARTDDGQVFFAAAGALAPVPFQITFNTWTRLDAYLNTLTGVATLRINGNVVATASGPAGTAGLGDVDLFNTRIATALSGDSVFTDNYIAEAIPTPGAAALLSLGLLGAARRRR